MKKFISLGSVLAFALPVVVFAQTTQGAQINDVNGLIRKLVSIGNALIPIFISFAVIYLVYAIVVYIIAGDETKKEEGKKMVFWGIIGLFLILSIWGIVGLLRRSFNFGSNQSVPTQDFPKIQTIPGV
jgi:hypothetical protein